MLLAVALICPAGAFGQSVPSSRTEIAYSFAPVVRQVAPAVVTAINAPTGLIIGGPAQVPLSWTVANQGLAATPANTWPWGCY